MAEQYLADYYAQRANEYDAIYRKPERQNDIRLLAAHLTELLASRSVLEIACGTGFWTQFFAPGSTFVTATDYNDDVLRIAKQRLSCLANVCVKQADAFALDGLGLDFDCGYAGFWWSHLEKAKIRPFLREFHSALRPGSRVIFTDNLYVEGSSTVVSGTDNDGNTFQFRKLADGRQYEILKNFPTESEFREAVGESGVNIHFKKLAYFWCGWYETSRG